MSEDLIWAAKERERKAELARLHFEGHGAPRSRFHEKCDLCERAFELEPKARKFILEEPGQPTSEGNLLDILKLTDLTADEVERIIRLEPGESTLLDYAYGLTIRRLS